MDDTVFVSVLRAMAVLLLLPAALMPVEKMGWARSMEVQLVLATLVLVFLLVDPIAGLILGLVLLLVYARVYRRLAPAGPQPWLGGMGGSSSSAPVGGGPAARGQGLEAMQRQYITPALLKDAQNNIVSTKAYDTEIVGFAPVRGEKIYGAQALGDQGLTPGFDPMAAPGGPTNLEQVA